MPRNYKVMSRDNVAKCYIAQATQTSVMMIKMSYMFSVLRTNRVPLEEEQMNECARIFSEVKAETLGGGKPPGDISFSEMEHMFYVSLKKSLAMLGIKMNIAITSGIGEPN